MKQTLDHAPTHAEQAVMERRYRLPYNWLLKEYHRGWRQKNGLWALAYELSGSLTGKRVLDVGCGDGWYTRHMLEAGADTTGVDYSQQAVEFAKLINPSVPFVHAPVQSMPFPDQSFETVFSFQVIEHIPPDELPEGVTELRRVIKDDGMLIVSVPSIQRSLSRAHFQHFTLETLQKTLAPRFTLVSAVGQERKTRFLRVISMAIENRFWLLFRLSTAFNRKGYIRYYNKTSASVGQNIVAHFKPTRS